MLAQAVPDGPVELLADRPLVVEKLGEAPLPMNAVELALGVREGFLPRAEHADDEVDRRLGIVPLAEVTVPDLHATVPNP